MRGPLRIDLNNDEILADLSWPGPPPGRWLDRETAHIDLLLGSIERFSPDRAGADGARTATPGRRGRA